MNAVVDDAALGAAVPAGAPQLGQTQLLAQGIICGPWALAFSFDWARSIIEDFELSPVPKAPPWLAGAANVEGTIIPVIDLALFINPESAHQDAGAARRLLVGGTLGGSDEEALGILFTRLPQQLRFERQSLDDIGSLPQALADVCIGYAQDAAGQMYLEVDVQRLGQSMSAQLSVL